MRDYGKLYYTGEEPDIRLRERVLKTNRDIARTFWEMDKGFLFYVSCPFCWVHYHIDCNDCGYGKIHGVCTMEDSDFAKVVAFWRSLPKEKRHKAYRLLLEEEALLWKKLTDEEISPAEYCRELIRTKAWILTLLSKGKL